MPYELVTNPLEFAERTFGNTALGYFVFICPTVKRKETRTPNWNTQVTFSSFDSGYPDVLFVVVYFVHFVLIDQSLT
jgi:hypothetical protein